MPLLRPGQVNTTCALGRAGTSHRLRPRALTVSLLHCECVDDDRFAG
jgi:hypothetical protein